MKKNLLIIIKLFIIVFSLIIIFFFLFFTIIDLERSTVNSANIMFLFANSSNIEGGIGGEFSEDGFQEFLLADDLSYLSGFYRAERWSDIGDFFEDYKYVLLIRERKLVEYGLLDTSSVTFLNISLSNVFDIVASDNPFERANSLKSDSPSSLVILDYLEEDISSEEFKWLLINEFHYSLEGDPDQFLNDLRYDESFTPKKTILVRFVRVIPIYFYNSFFDVEEMEENGTVAVSTGRTFIHLIIRYISSIIGNMQFIPFNEIIPSEIETEAETEEGSDGVTDGNDTLIPEIIIDELNESDIDIYNQAITTGNDELCTEIQNENIREMCYEYVEVS